MSQGWKEFLTTVKKLDKKNKKFFFRKIVVAGHNFEDIPNIEFPTSDFKDVMTISARNRKNFYPQSVIDLHGFTEEQAVNRLTSFIFDNYVNNKRSVLVITGGNEKDNKPIRKIFISLVNRELSHLISEICVSEKKHGGEGAFYVKIRKFYKK